MKKTLFMVWLFLSLFMVTACQEQTTDIESTADTIEIESIEIDSDTVRSSYTVDSFSIDDIDLTLFFSDGSESNIDLAPSMIEQELNTIIEVGTYTLDVSFHTLQTSFDVLIEDYVNLTSIEIKQYNPYALVSTFNIQDIKLILSFENNQTKEISINYDMLDQTNTNKLFREGIHEIQIDYQGLETSFMIALYSEYPSPEILELGEDEAIFYEVLEKLQNYHYSDPDQDALYRGALTGMIESLNDPYTRYHDQESYEQYASGLSEDYVGLGFHVQIVDDMLVVTRIFPNSPAEEAGLMTDDMIRFVDGIAVTEENAMEMIYNLLGEVGDTITLQIERPGVQELITFNLEFSVIDNPSVSVDYQMDGQDKYGIIKVNSFGEETADLFEDALISLEDDSLKGLVVDVRNNSGGYLGAVLDMLQHFLLNNGRPLFTLESYANGFNIDIFYGVINEVKPYDIVVLVNENSASASEVFAVSMQEHGDYQVIGTQTYGKGVAQTFVNMEEKPDDYLIVTHAKWFSPSGNWVDRNGGTNGVIPDIIVETNELESTWKVYISNDEIIEYDSVDDRLESIQVILNGMGYNLRTDGYYDEATKLAIENIQTNNALTVTGNINQETLTIINNWLEDYQANTDTQLDEALETLKNN